MILVFSDNETVSEVHLSENSTKSISCVAQNIFPRPVFTWSSEDDIILLDEKVFIDISRDHLKLFKLFLVRGKTVEEDLLGHCQF